MSTACTATVVGGDGQQSPGRRHGAVCDSSERRYHREGAFQGPGVRGRHRGQQRADGLVQGQGLEEALALTKDDLAAALDGLSERKRHCCATGRRVR